MILRTKKNADESQRGKGRSNFAKLFFSKMMKTGEKSEYNFKGFGMSIVDQEPKELMYISMYKVSYISETWTEKVADTQAPEKGKQQQYYDETTTS
jgi:hypothetical protein